MAVAYILALLIVYQAGLVASYSGGAPANACPDLNPSGHGSSTNTGPAPYNLTLSAYTYQPGDVIEVTLSGLGGAQFKGYLILARQSGGPTVNIGNFTAVANSKIACPLASGNGVTHTDRNSKSFVSFNWTAPSTSEGDLVFHYTVVRGGAPNTTADKQDFFQNLTSVTLKAATVNIIKNPECGKTRGCFSSCDNNTCDWEITWKANGAQYDFTIKALVTAGNKYVALGFSNASLMSPASVVSCTLFNSLVEVNASFNTGHSNKPLTQPKEGISNENNTYSSGILSCSFSRVATSSNPQIFNLTQPWYINTAEGPLNADGILGFHGRQNRFVTTTQINLSNATTDYSIPWATTTTATGSTTIATTFSTVTTPTIPPGSAIVKNTECGKTRGCFSSCDNNFCNWEFTWKANGSQYDFTIKAVAVGNAYIALGFSTASAMSTASVLACTIYNGQVGVYASYNTGHVNQPLVQQKEGISNEKNTYSNGILSCSFSRVTTSNNPQIFNLTQPWYLNTAEGPSNSGGIIEYHVDKFVTNTQINVLNVSTDYTLPWARPTTATGSLPTATTFPPGSAIVKNTECGKTRGCFSSCDNNFCNWEFTWKANGAQYDFTIKAVAAPGNTYVALGLSTASAMSKASVLACTIYNGGFGVYASYNTDHSNQPLVQPKEGISNENNTYSNGILSCSFSRVATSSNPQIFNLTQPWYLNTAEGPSNADGSIGYHGYADRYFTKTQINLSNVSTDYTLPWTRPTTSPPVSTSPFVPGRKFPKDPGCGKIKGCYSSCEDNLCDFLYSWENNGPNFNISFKSEFSKSGDYYVALGFSNDDKMNPASVLSCSVYQSQVGVYASFNPGHSNTPLANNLEGLSKTQGSFVDGILSCSVLRETVSNNSQIYNLTELWYLITAIGNAGPGGILTQHSSSQRTVSTSRINFSDPTVDLSANFPDFSLVKAHGCLMAITWMFAVSLGLAMARFFKSQWPDNKLCGVKIWFAVHRAVMALAFLVGCAAFIIIFLHVNGYSDISGETFKKAHPVLGIIVTSLLVINPFMSLLRCAPDHPKRPIFNWAHWLVGTTAHILGGITITLGLYLPSANLNSSKGLAIMIVYGSWHVVFFLAMSLIDYMSKRNQSKGSLDLNASGSLKDIGQPGPANYGPLSGSNEPQFSLVKKLLLLSHIIILVCLTGSLMNLVITGDI